MIRIPSHDNQRSADRSYSNWPRVVSRRFIPFRFAKGQWYNASSCTLLHTAACHAEARLLIFRYAAAKRFSRCPFNLFYTRFFFNPTLHAVLIRTSDFKYFFPDLYLTRIEVFLFTQIQTYVNRFVRSREITGMLNRNVNRRVRRYSRDSAIEPRIISNISPAFFALNCQVINRSFTCSIVNSRVESKIKSNSFRVSRQICRQQTGSIFDITKIKSSHEFLDNSQFSAVLPSQRNTRAETENGFRVACSFQPVYTKLVSYAWPKYLIFHLSRSPLERAFLFMFSRCNRTALSTRPYEAGLLHFRVENGTRDILSRFHWLNSTSRGRPNTRSLLFHEFSLKTGILSYYNNSSNDVA